MIAEGDTVATLVTVTGTHRGEFLGMRATGRKIRLTAIDIFRFADGRAVEHWGVIAIRMTEQLVPSRTQPEAATGS
jgi:predicted ester cyclase